jgi:flagellar basal-body rod modification protein FlgD
MDISSTLTTTAAQATVTDTIASTSEISSDFETFLKMLTVQMQNQDPLNPVDSSDYAVQLATFSNVEQQVQTNDILKELKAQLGLTGIAQMADWVGKEARAVAPAQLDGAPITIFPAPASTATEMDIVVRDASGFEVARFTSPVTSDPIEWAGVNADGSPFATGLYTFDVESYDGDILIETNQAAVYATVREVQKTPDGETQVVFEGGTTVSSNDVSAIRGASS